MDDISGTGNIGNIVDNAFIIHRANVDFWKSAEKFYGKDLYKIIPRQEQPNEYGNVIEICKNRENGIQDFFVPLWYESSTKRLNPMPNDNHNYSWLFNAAVETPLDEDVPW